MDTFWEGVALANEATVKIIFWGIVIGAVSYVVLRALGVRV